MFERPSAEHVSNLALVDKNNQILLKNNAVPVLLTQLKRELSSDVETLSSQGTLDLHQRTLNALLSTVARLRPLSTQNDDSAGDSTLVQSGLADELIKVVKTRSELEDPLSESLSLLVKYYYL